VVESWREIDCAKESSNIALFTPTDEFAQGVIYRVFLRTESANPLCPGEKAIVNLEIRRHVHTLIDTERVSRMALLRLTLKTTRGRRLARRVRKQPVIVILADRSTLVTKHVNLDAFLLRLAE